MFRQFRIKQINGAVNTSFIVQHKWLGLFWYNPLNIDGVITGHFDTLKEAESMLKTLKYKDKVKYHLWKIKAKKHK